MHVLDDTVTEADVMGALNALASLWDELLPAKQAWLVNLLIERVDTRKDGRKAHQCASQIGFQQK